MSDKIEIAIEEVRNLIVSLERELMEKKRTVNSLCSIIQKPPIYGDAELAESTHQMQVNSDAYYGKETPDVIEDILRRRRASGKGAMPVNEIYDAMVAGGYYFQTANHANAKRGIYISLGKNPKFHKLPNGSYGLTEWYPAAKEPKSKNGGADKTQEIDPFSGVLDDLLGEPVQVPVGDTGGDSAEEPTPKEPGPRKGPVPR